MWIVKIALQRPYTFIVLAIIIVLLGGYVSEEAAVTASGRALEQARYRYKAGLVTYLEVATAETIALQAQLSRVNILNRYMNASVLLVKALGGGWGNDARDQSPSSTSATAALDVEVVR